MSAQCAHATALAADKEHDGAAPTAYLAAITSARRWRRPRARPPLGRWGGALERGDRLYFDKVLGHGESRDGNQGMGRH